MPSIINYLRIPPSILFFLGSKTNGTDEEAPVAILIFSLNIFGSFSAKFLQKKRGYALFQSNEITKTSSETASFILYSPKYSKSS